MGPPIPARCSVKIGRAGSIICKHVATVPCSVGSVRATSALQTHTLCLEVSLVDVAGSKSYRRIDILARDLVTQS